MIITKSLIPIFSFDEYLKISLQCVSDQFLTVTKMIINKFRQLSTLADFMRWVTGGLRFVDKLSLLLQCDMQTCPQWSKSVHMETIQLNILLIFLILLTAHNAQKEGFIYWLLTANHRYKISYFFSDPHAPDSHLLAGQDVEQCSMQLNDV